MIIANLSVKHGRGCASCQVVQVQVQVQEVQTVQQLQPSTHECAPIDCSSVQTVLRKDTTAQGHHPALSHNGI